MNIILNIVKWSGTFKVECHLSLQKNEGNSESNDALEAAEAQAAGSREPAAEDKPPSLTTGGEQDECPPLFAGEEPVSAGAEMEEPPAPPAGEMEESGAVPAGQDDTDTHSDSLKEEKPAVSG